MKNKIRLAKKIAESGIASRREAERMIEAGRVKVDGIIVKTPVFFVSDANTISVDEKAVSKKSKEIKIWKFYKPTGVITSRQDCKGRPNVFEFFKNYAQDRLLYVGRLDCNSEGLLLFTNNGDLARKMELPKTALKRVYRVRIFGKLSETAKKELKRGIAIDGIKFGSVDIIEENATTTSKNRWLKIVLTEGKNREIRKLMRYFGCIVNRLIRISYGPFELNELQLGKIEKIKKEEVKSFLKTIKFTLGKNNAE